MREKLYYYTLVDTLSKLYKNNKSSSYFKHFEPVISRSRMDEMSFRDVRNNRIYRDLYINSSCNTDPKALINVCQNNCDDILLIRTLLNQGININEKDDYLKTALYYSIINKSNDLIIELIHNGASYNDIICRKSLFQIAKDHDDAS